MYKILPLTKTPTKIINKNSKFVYMSETKKKKKQYYNMNLNMKANIQLLEIPSLEKAMIIPNPITAIPLYS